jgi:hypothetical protein
MNISRREAVIKLALLMGASALGPRLLAAKFGEGDPAKLPFSTDEIALLDAIGDTIIPATDIPGAKAVGIGAFIAMMVDDCYRPKDQAGFKAGLAELAKVYETRFGVNFVAGKSTDRTEFLNELDHEQRKYTAANRRKNTVSSYEMGKADDTPATHYFRMMRELTILGYFSSEIGSSKAVQYMEVPGRYDGNVPYKKGDMLYV